MENAETIDFKQLMRNGLKYVDVPLVIGVTVAVLIGAFMMIGTRHIKELPLFFLMGYFIGGVLQIFGFTFGLAKMGLNEGSATGAGQGCGTVFLLAIPVYTVATTLILLDVFFNWRLAANPISLIMFFFSLRYLVARRANRIEATDLLRGANPTSAADGVAAQRRETAPDFSRAQRPLDVDDLDAPQPSRVQSRPAESNAMPRPNLGKAPAPARPDFADATRPPDED